MIENSILLETVLSNGVVLPIKCDTVEQALAKGLQLLGNEYVVNGEYVTVIDYGIRERITYA